MTTYQTALEEAKSIQTHLDAPLADAHYLLACALNVSTVKLFSQPHEILNTKQKHAWHSYKTKWSNGYPIEYIVSQACFLDLSLYVTPDVLIPRSSTEIMTQAALQIIKNQPWKILDLCTGSACIALGIKTRCPNTHVTASDISRNALRIAQKNIQLYKENIKLLRSHLFSNITDKSFNMIISNPPYIGHHETQYTQQTFEPRISRYSKKNGLFHIEKIIEEAPKFLEKSGYLLIEYGFEQSHEVEQLMKTHRYTNIQTHQDTQKHPRFTIAQQ